VFCPDWTFRAGQCGERDGWGPGGYKWRRWDHLKEERGRADVEARGRADVADLYEWAVMSTSDGLLPRLA
jgi:hypothetical protein